MSENKVTIIISDCIFDSISCDPYKGYICIKNGLISKVEKGEFKDEANNENNNIVNAIGMTVMAGAIDVHCFFAGYALEQYQKLHNQTPTEPTPQLLKEILNDRDYIIPFFKKHMKMLNSKGITTVKEMGFDDYYGFTDILKELEASNELSVRFHFMSQPVESPINISYGQKMREEFNSDYAKFSGYNMMTDGSVSENCAEIKQPYKDIDTNCLQDIDWDLIKKDVLLADENGFRYSLHAQGDAAIHNAIEVLDSCQKSADGKLKNRHSITDLEFSDESDFKKMGELGIVGEIYPQIQSIAKRDEKLKMIDEKIGSKRGANYWNRRAAIDADVILSCGTDLPLLIDDIPESIYHAVGGLFPDSPLPFNEKNMITRSELLKSWTYGGAYNLSSEDNLGSIEPGKYADLVIFDGDLFETDIKNIRDIKVKYTFLDGQLVYQK